MTFKIQTLNHISVKGLERLSQETYDVAADISEPDAIILRSHSMHDMELPASLKVIGRAGAGVNNIPVDKCSQLGIPVLNTPGANANAVKELVLTGMLLASRNIFQAWEYSKTLDGDDDAIHREMEKQKKQFVGCELLGKTLGVIGVGSIGVSVANMAIALGMNVVAYDPDITTHHAWQVSSEVSQASSMDELLAKSDFVTLHVPLLETTRNLLNASRIEMLSQEAVLLNFSRDGIVDNHALKKALERKSIKAYVSDFPNNLLRDLPNTINLPHLGASTFEAEENCAVMIADQIQDYLEMGHIKNSVNFPSISMPMIEGYRLVVINANVPNMVAQISEKLSHAELNICDMINKSRDQVAYSLFDVDQVIDEKTCQEISRIEGVLNVRCIAGQHFS